MKYLIAAWIVDPYDDCQYLVGVFSSMEAAKAKIEAEPPVLERGNYIDYQIAPLDDYTAEVKIEIEMEKENAS